MQDKVTSYSALLGQLIGSIRQQKGRDQTDVADSLGISQASYSRLESGKAIWSVDQLMVVCDSLEVPVGSVMQLLVDRKEDLTDTAHIDVIAAGRSNSRGAEEKKGQGGAFLAGAALGAILTTLVTRR